MDQLARQLMAFWQGMNATQRIALLSVLLIGLGTVALLMNFATEPSYGTLYSNLVAEDASSIVDELSGMQVPYKLTRAGTTVLVPVERIYDLRLEMVTKGLPASGPVGFEIFNETSLGMTPFQQRIQLRRALEGELARTISRLSTVDWSRVHITLPDRTLFRREKQHPTAAVVLHLKAGRNLSSSEVAGVAHLISGSVEGLDSDQVTIMDSKGRLLSRPGGDDSDALAADALDIQRTIEMRLAAQAQSLLDATIGPERSIVTVSAVVNRERFEERKERVNPEEAAVISEQRSEETRSTPSSSLGGVPGTQSNVPGGLAAEGGSGESATESVSRETINFEISKSTSQTIVPMGKITRLSVAVIVDGTYRQQPVAEAGDGEEAEEVAPETVYEPRSQEELDRLAEIVRRAVGFDAERGDLLEIQNLRFRNPLEDVAAEPLSYWMSPEFMILVPTVTRGFAVIGGLLLLVFFVLRPALRQLADAQALAGSVAAAGPGSEIPGEQRLEIGNADAELAIPVSKDQAKQVAEAMKQWLRE